MSAIRLFQGHQDRHFHDLVYYHGDTPKPLRFSVYSENEAGILALDESIAGATLRAKLSIDGGVETLLSVINNGDGTGEIVFPSDASVLLVGATKNESTGRIDIEVVDGAYVSYLQRFTFPIEKRV